jgi:pantoate--beta-alanine ligase
MDIITSVAALRERLEREPNNVFVPTMGNLHAGHMQLIRLAKLRAACTVVSVFVNRLQFGPREDFERYPRTLQSDAEKARDVGADVVFAPSEAEIYPEPQTFVVEPSDLQHILEGAFRPGHFRGVATVVLKLFNMVRPHTAIFGKKDYQQYVVLRDMVKQLALPVEILPAETVRAPDGLALSSRNTYLSGPERKEAPRLYQTLQAARAEIAAGKRDFQRIELQAMSALADRGWRPDYISVRRQSDLQQPGASDREVVVLAAALLGRTRLIDNVEVPLSERTKNKRGREGRWFQGISRSSRRIRLHHEFLDRTSQRLGHRFHTLLIDRYRLVVGASTFALDKGLGGSLRIPDHDRVRRNPGHLDANRDAVRLVHDCKHVQPPHAHRSDQGGRALTVRPTCLKSSLMALL